MKLAKWASIFFTVCSILLFLFSILKRQSSIDFQFHDTYFVIAALHLNLVLAVYNLICAIIYFRITGSLAKKWMVWLHIVATLLILYIYFFAFNSTETPDASYYSIPDFPSLFLPLISMVIFIIANVLFGYNLLMSRISYRKVD